MVWAKFRFGNGDISPVWSPMSSAGSFTLTKRNVMMFKTDGSVLYAWPFAQLAEIQDDVSRMVSTPQSSGEGDKRMTWYVWTTQPRELRMVCGGQERKPW